MGAINNAFNQAAGAVAIAGRMIGHEKESAISRGETAVNEDIELAAKQKDATSEFNEAYNADYHAKKDKELLREMQKNPEANGISSAEDRKALAQLQRQNMDDRKAAQIALNEAGKKIIAISQMRERAAKQIEKGRAWGGNY